MPDSRGTYTLPILLYLDEQQRRKLERLVMEQQQDLSEIVTQIIAAHLEGLSDPPPPEPVNAVTRAADLAARRSELARLRARRLVSGASTPAWLSSYIAELEEEIRRLESVIARG